MPSCRDHETELRELRAGRSGVRRGREVDRALWMEARASDRGWKEPRSLALPDLRVGCEEANGLTGVVALYRGFCGRSDEEAALLVGCVVERCTQRRAVSQARCLERRRPFARRSARCGGACGRSTAGRDRVAMGRGVGPHSSRRSPLAEGACVAPEARDADGARAARDSPVGHARSRNRRDGDGRGHQARLPFIGFGDASRSRWRRRGVHRSKTRLRRRDRGGRRAEATSLSRSNDPIRIG